MNENVKEVEWTVVFEFPGQPVYPNEERILSTTVR